MPRDADYLAIDLLQQILVQEPNLRINWDEIRNHKFYSDVNWSDVEHKKQKSVPYKPNPMKHKYLLQNTYPLLNNQM